MNHKLTITLLQNLHFSEDKPDALKPIDLSLLTYLILRQTEDHFIYDSQLTLAERLGCKRDAIAASIEPLEALGWIVCMRPFDWNPKTRRKTRTIGGTVGAGRQPGKIAKERFKHSQPSPDALELAARHTKFLASYRTKQPKNFRRQQEHAAQRIIDALGSFDEAVLVVNFGASDVRFQKAVLKSLYEVRKRLPAIKSAYDAAQSSAPAEVA